MQGSPSAAARVDSGVHGSASAAATAAAHVGSRTCVPTATATTAARVVSATTAARVISRSGPTADGVAEVMIRWVCEDARKKMLAKYGLQDRTYSGNQWR